MKKEVLFILLNDFADSEGSYIASCLNYGVMPGSESQYVVKTVAPTKEPVISMGGFKVLPDYSIDDIPADHAGVVLIGGMSWFTPEASLFVPVVKEAMENRKLVAGICNASVFLGMHGILNDVRHTSNGIDYLKQFAGTAYTGDANYVDELAVRDGMVVTACGFGALEFCREILYALQADTPKKIEKTYRMTKTGVWENPEVD